eukprot:TRINITY_DN8102_c0_g1_i2.p1 TRINITY_DN8102_c0_g1~~TRINITY_DN8102_c0_g1_i2.p1  ORF type:complete len:287 (-),score=42.01 TRINITY_DN8102_c0_g1_i2:11-835(-)
MFCLTAECCITNHIAVENPHPEEISADLDDNRAYKRGYGNGFPVMPLLPRTSCFNSNLEPTCFDNRQTAQDGPAEQISTEDGDTAYTDADLSEPSEAIARLNSPFKTDAVARRDESSKLAGPVGQVPVFVPLHDDGGTAFEEIQSTTYKVHVRLEEGDALGLVVDVTEGNASVASVKPGSIIDDWNSRCHSAKVVRPDDYLVGVNGVEPFELISELSKVRTGPLHLTFAYPERVDAQQLLKLASETLSHHSEPGAEAPRVLHPRALMPREKTQL